MKERIIILGGVAAGMSAATRLRRLKEEAEIIVLERGPDVSFANCGLPYYISGEIANHDSLLVQTPAGLKERFNLDVRVNQEVTEINPQQHSILVKNSQGIEELTFDKLIIAAGAAPFIPEIKGNQGLTNTFTLRNVVDLDKIMIFLEQNSPGRAVVVGGGFIGLELAENLSKRGIAVTLVERNNQILAPVDVEMAHQIENELKRNGIEVKKQCSLIEISDQGHSVILDNGEQLATEAIFLAIGVKPETGLALKAGIKLHANGGILVNESYQTNYPDVYAIGDVITVKNLVSKADSLVPLASPANRQGRYVADIIAGKNRSKAEALGTAIVRVFDKVIATTGLNERTVRQLDYPVEVVHITANDHAGYFPNAQPIFLKLIFNPQSGVIYGAQIVGKNGVDKRIDVISTAIKAGLKVQDLPDLELAYAPPFGSAKDPVNMLGYAALNILEGNSESVQWHQLLLETQQGASIIDVRTPEEIKKYGKLHGSIGIPLAELRNSLSQLDKAQPYIVSCQSGLRSYLAERILKQHGFKVRNLDGAFGLTATMLPELVITDSK